MAGNFDGDDPASDTSWYELVDGFQDGGETSASSDSQVDWSESDSGSDSEYDGSGGELSNGGSGEDDDAAAHWTARNDDVDVPPFTRRSGLQVEPPLENPPPFVLQALLYPGCGRFARCGDQPVCHANRWESTSTSITSAELGPHRPEVFLCLFGPVLSDGISEETSNCNVLVKGTPGRLSSIWESHESEQMGPNIEMLALCG